MDDITYVISTHGHSDHLGNNNLFLKARHIVGDCISERDKYYLHDFTAESYRINEDIEVVATPGHTTSCVSVIVKNTNMGGTVGIVGDLFERAEDIDNSELWLDAGSTDEQLQKQNRSKIAELVDVIVPGHGPLFYVSHEIRCKLKDQIQNSS